MEKSIRKVVRICPKCKFTFSSKKCERCIFITANEEADEKFDKICKETELHGVELLDIKKISGKCGK